jgi:hypothetical protein
MPRPFSESGTIQNSKARKPTNPIKIAPISMKARDQVSLCIIAQNHSGALRIKKATKPLERNPKIKAKLASKIYKALLSVKLFK